MSTRDAVEDAATLDTEVNMGWSSLNSSCKIRHK